MVQVFQQPYAITSHLLGPRLALIFLFGQQIATRSLAVTLEPVRSDSLFQPVGCLKRQLIQGMPERLMHQLELVKSVNGCHNVRRVGSLFAPRFEQPACFKLCEHDLEETCFRTAARQS